MSPSRLEEIRALVGTPILRIDAITVGGLFSAARDLLEAYDERTARPERRYALLQGAISLMCADIQAHEVDMQSTVDDHIDAAIDMLESIERREKENV